MNNANNLKIGIFGGSFNPPHNGHVNLAEAAHNQLRLDKTLIIPTKQSPHKVNADVPFEDRVEMARLAFGDCAGFEISAIEGRQSGKNYTIDTIRALRGIYPRAAFYLIIGGDMLTSFNKWYKHGDILKEATVAAAARKDNFNELSEHAAKLGAKLIKTAVFDVSSSEIREKIADGGDFDLKAAGLLNPKVYDYIKERGFYQRAE